MHKPSKRDYPDYYDVSKIKVNQISKDATHKNSKAIMYCFLMVKYLTIDYWNANGYANNRSKYKK